jgi:hypothetical protein
MADVIPAAPSVAMAAAAAAVTTVTDATGRKIAFRNLNILEQARIYKAIGPAQAENGPYVRLATMAAAVVSLDDIPAPPMPTNDREVEASLLRLGEHGFIALSLEFNRRAEEAIAAANAIVANAKN